MFGIASYQQIDKDSLKPSFWSALNQKFEDSCINTSWSLAHARDVFEDPDIAVVSDSEIYNERELAKLVDQEPLNHAHLIGMLYRQFGLEKVPA